MHRGSKINFPILAVLLFSSFVRGGAPAESEPRAGDSSPLARALFLAEESSMGLTLVPELLEAPSQTPWPSAVSQTSVSYLDAERRGSADPRQLIIDDRQLLSNRKHRTSRWEASVAALAAARLDEDILIDSTALGTGIHSGAKVRLADRFGSLSGVLHGWELIALGLKGKESIQGYDYPDEFGHEASFLSVESNVIHRSEHKRRVRKQFLGVRYVDQTDAITFKPYLFFYDPPQRQEAKNRMLGIQFGIDQSWSSWQRLEFGWGAKAGVFYNRADQTGYLHNGTASEFPVLLDYHADLAYQLFDGAYLAIGLIGMQLTDQHQSRYAWRSPEHTESVTILGMRMGFDYNY